MLASHVTTLKLMSYTARPEPMLAPTSYDVQLAAATPLGQTAQSPGRLETR